MKERLLKKDNVIVNVYKQIPFRHKTQNVYEIKTIDPHKHIILTEDELCHVVMIAPKQKEIVAVTEGK